MSIKIEHAFNGYIIIDSDFGEVGRKIVVENFNDSAYECTLDELKANRNLLYTVIELLGLRLHTTDEAHSLLLLLKDDQGVILPDD